MTNYDQIGQSSATGEVTKFTEKITIGDRTLYISRLPTYQKVRLQISVQHQIIIQENAIARKTYTETTGA